VTSIRLLPVVILAIAALLIFKSVGIVTQGGYVLAGVGHVQAAGGGGGHGGGGGEAAASGETLALPSEPTIEDTNPTLESTNPTLGAAAPGGDHGATAAADHGAAGSEPATATDASHGETAPAEGDVAVNSVVLANACDPRPVGEGEPTTEDGQLTVMPGDCPLPADAVPQAMTSGGAAPLSSPDATPTERALLERLSTRRAELEAYEQELSMRASLVDAAEKRIEERQATLEGIESQIASLVEQRKAMEEGQFAAIVAMYGTMKPKDAAAIFDQLDMEVLVRVAKMMTPRKMAPILAAMNTGRAQELTVRLASAETDPLESMTPENLAALPQIVGQ
jgi:flagellar motility protein MotE (MotC chaperone)